MKLAILTKIPSPYQVELFDTLAQAQDLDLSVVYLRQRDPDRSWSDRALRHRAVFLDGDAQGAAAAMSAADLAVFAWYRDPGVSRLIRERARARRPWCFWGEKPGVTHGGLLGMAYRRWRLWPLWRERRAAIWGIGHWAVEGYRKEFGARAYYHVPYVSNLAPFFAIERRPETRATTLLFSGSLIERKGVRELCAAFRRIAARRKELRLIVLGGGPLEGELRRGGTDERITFLGFRDWNALADAYREADVLCAPSRYDGWGMIVPEAMASGMPVIASTNMGSAREMVIAGQTGWLVEPRSVEALEAAIEHAAARSAEELAAMRDRCRDMARNYDVVPGASRLHDAARGSLRGWTQ
jgi:glycosyltransferase involved in cell wall biosynthesis